MCPTCGLIFDQLRKKGSCCGHCRGGKGHGKNCEGRYITAKARPRRPSPRNPNPVIEAKARPRRPLRLSAIEIRPRSRSRDENRRRSAASSEPASSSARPPAEETTPHCVVCHSRACTHACIPCGHRILCETCGADDSMTRMYWKCPQCREPVIEVVRIYL